MSPSKPIAAAIYIRVSTFEQKHDLQASELRAYAERMGWATVEYAEKGSALKKRPVLEQLMRDAKSRKFDVVIVWKMDRFARSLTQLMENMANLDSYGIRFIAATQGIDTDRQNPAGRLLMQILGAIAEFERGLIVERVRSGMAEARRRGKHLGPPVLIWDRSEAVELRKQGLSYRAIAAKVGQPEASVRRALKNSV